MRWLAIALVAATLGASVVFGCGEEQDSPGTSATAPAGEASSPPVGTEAPPPELAECLGERGYEIDSPDDVHAAPPEALAACSGH